MHKLILIILFLATALTFTTSTEARPSYSDPWWCDHLDELPPDEPGPNCSPNEGIEITAMFVPEQVRPGEESTFFWTSNAETCFIGDEIVPRHGSKPMIINQTTTVTVHCRNSNTGAYPKEATVTALYDPPQVTAWFDPHEVDPEGYTLLKWNSEHADSCSTNSPFYSQLSGTSGQIEGPSDVNLSIVDIKIVCTGQGGSDSSTARLRIKWPKIVKADDVYAPSTGKEINVTWRADYVNYCHLNNEFVGMPNWEGAYGSAWIFAKSGDTLNLVCYGNTHLPISKTIRVWNDFSSSIE